MPRTPKILNSIEEEFRELTRPKDKETTVQETDPRLIPHKRLHDLQRPGSNVRVAKSTNQ